ncbi:MAG: tetratricopeptide repeat protein [Prevotella sp.]|nr:tetratricopeptide repeat protein [Prevotella sp.]
MRKKQLFILAIILSVMGCGPHPDAQSLAAIDSLLIEGQNDSAYHEVLRLQDTPFHNDGDKAHYNLLLTQTSYLTANTLDSDTLIDFSIDYYKRNGDMENLTDAYYYKASGYYDREDYQQAVVLFKEAENIAMQTGNLRHLYKIDESLYYVNGFAGNYNLQLDYARKSLHAAQAAAEKNWIAYSYYHLCHAFQNLEIPDSFCHYAERLAPYLEEAYPEDRPHFLACMGFMHYKRGEWQQARNCYEEALEYQENSLTLGNLADVCVKENKEEEAYRLWKRAFMLDDGQPKDVVIYNMLQYDLDHHRGLEDACERLYAIYAIKDSVNTALKDRTIQTLQQQYDEEAASHAYEKKLMTRGLIAAMMAVIILILVVYHNYQQAKAKAAMNEQKILLSQYVNEKEQLEKKVRNAEQCIKEDKVMIANYESQVEHLKNLNAHSEPEPETPNKDGYEWQVIASCRAHIEELKAEREQNLQKIDELSANIGQLVDGMSVRLAHGKILYDHVLLNGTTLDWNADEYKCFVEYYKASHLVDYKKIEQQHPNLTPHNAFFLILYEIGKTDDEVCRIMGISREAIRSTRYRIKKRDGK